jgi:hypothetical protein
VKSDPFHSVESLTVQIPPAVGLGRRVNSPKTYPRGGRRDRFAFRLLGTGRKETLMPRFYFDLREGPRFTPDEEGLEFASLDGTGFRAARPATSASRCATSIIGSCLR